MKRHMQSPHESSMDPMDVGVSPHESSMDPMDVGVKRSKVKVTMQGLLKKDSGA